MKVARVRIYIDARMAPAGILSQINELARTCPGATKVIVDLDSSEGPRRLILGTRIDPCERFYAGVRALGWSAVPEPVEGATA